MISKRQTRQQKGYTLIELQVVVATIVILTGKFLRALSWADGKAKQFRCACKLHQFTRSFQLDMHDRHDQKKLNSSGELSKIGGSYFANIAGNIRFLKYGESI